MTVMLRRTGPGDEGVFTAIAADVFDEPIHPERLQIYLQTTGHLMVLAIDDRVVVGQCAAVVHRHPDKPDELYIDEVGTASTHLRRGIATAMMEEMFAWGRELGCEGGWLGTELDNVEARGLYEKLKAGPGEKMIYYEFGLQPCEAPTPDLTPRGSTGA
jgi:aminoglycoside 6'-N-acetyltransferase I